MNRRLPPAEEMQHAVQRRDTEYDGLFWFGVRSTGIFCRPGCAARTPRPENLRYFPTPQSALFAGFRACKRCRPLQPPSQSPEWLQPLLDRVESRPDERVPDAELRRMGLDPARVRRHFKRQYGMTFQAYCRSQRLGRALDGIREGRDLDDVALDHGFDSHSGFREAFTRLFGKPPRALRDGDRIVIGWVESPLGPLLAGASRSGICLLEFTDRRMIEAQCRTLRRRFELPIVPGRHELLDRLRDELAEYFAGTRQDFDLPLASPGTEFQQRVWSALRTIPYGRTWSYKQLADAVGSAGASRAVGTANGMNRIAVLIPCHRVVNADDQLRGYGGGLHRKQFLLDLERARAGRGSDQAETAVHR